MSSYALVDFALVRYSPVEGAHYFYDPAHPTAIQFLLNGQWEPWDVSYVKYKAQDPEIRRIAEDAETRLIRDNIVPGYQCWPTAPPPGGPVSAAHAPSFDETDSPLHSPSSVFRDNYSATPPGPSRSLQAGQPLLVSDSQAPPQANPPPPAVGPNVHPPAHPPAQTPAYTSPYRSEHPPPTPYTHAPWSSTPAPAPAHPVLHPLNTNVPGTHHPAQPPETTTRDPRPSSAVVPPVVPSKRRETKILLSLDGDGVRGLSQALLVESLVNAICTKIGAQIEPYQVFDLIGGCSMGGVLSIMLSRLRMQAHRAREAYKLVAKEVYPNKREFFTSFDPHAPPKEDTGQAVEDTIRSIVEKEIGTPDELFLDPRDDSADVFVVTTQINIGTNKPGLIRSFSTRRITGPELDANMTIWQAMRATVIAPRYMLPRDGVNWRPVIEPGLVDHGTAKNNPIRDIRFECSKLYRYGNDTMVIVSMGTGTRLDREREVPEIAKSVYDRTLEATVFAEKFEADHQALMERGWMKYFRFNVDLSDVPLEEWCHEDLVREKTSAYLARPDIGQMFYSCVDAITTVLLSGNMGRDTVPPSY